MFKPGLKIFVPEYSCLKVRLILHMVPPSRLWKVLVLKILKSSEERLLQVCWDTI